MSIDITDRAMDLFEEVEDNKFIDIIGSELEIRGDVGVALDTGLLCLEFLLESVDSAPAGLEVLLEFQHKVNEAVKELVNAH